jgi:hypothetical protein
MLRLEEVLIQKALLKTTARIPHTRIAAINARYISPNRGDTGASGK